MDIETRPLTDAERQYVQWHRAQTAGGSLKGLMLGAGCGTGCLSIPILGFVAHFGLLSSIRNRTNEGDADRIALVLIFLIPWVFFFILGLVHRRKAAAKRAEDRAQIDADLAGGIARIHRFRATEVIVGFTDERATRNYFVRLDDGRVLYLAPWRPDGCEVQGLRFLPDERGFPSATFEIAATPNYLLILDVVGIGDYLRPSDEFEMNDDENPEDDGWRLEAGRFLKVPWEEIRKQFG